jgi:hypothetical protein
MKKLYYVLICGPAPSFVTHPDEDEPMAFPSWEMATEAGNRVFASRSYGFVVLPWTADGPAFVIDECRVRRKQLFGQGFDLRWSSPFSFARISPMRKLISVLAVLGFVGCSMFKSAAKTADDAASILCELFAAENQSAVGMSPEDWCALHDNLEPFIDQVLAAKQAAGAAALGNPNADVTPSSEAQGTGP